MHRWNDCQRPPQFAMVVTSTVFGRSRGSHGGSGGAGAQSGVASTTKGGALIRRLMPCALHFAAVGISLINLKKNGCVAASFLNACLVLLIGYLSSTLITGMARSAE